MRALFCCLLALAVLLPQPAEADRAGATRRFALVAGANDGGAGRVRLRYATTDAHAVARVLEELGGVDPADRVVLEEPSRADFQRGLAEMRQRLAAAQASDHRVELFVYYSGHSDEEGLLLGEERFGYPELREALDMLPADVRVAILDSCSSGALTRRKGGVRRPPFLVDASTHVKGHAFLTSSSADEAAQESDRIGASFFTHFLVSGMRGAADTSRDGKVTLTEAYQFAFQETLARTARTSAGAQHPAYEMQLVGTGDLVMTDLRSTSAGLVVEEAVAGRVFIRDASGALVVELRKLPAAPVELGLAPGRYTVTVEEGGRLREAEVQLVDGKRVAVGTAQLRRVEGERNRVRGDEPPGDPDEGYVRVPFVLGIVPDMHTAGSPDDRVITGVGLNLLGGRTARLDGAVVGLGLNWHTEQASGAMLAIGGNLVGGEMSGAQLAVGFNHVGGALEGVQASVGYNGAAQGVRVGQLAVGANWSGGDTTGFQAATGGNWSTGTLRGAQFATGVNVARGGIKGVQLSSGANWVEGETRGYQGGAMANVAVGRLSGVQAGLANAGTEGGVGLQVGLASWMGGSFDGGQLGIANVAGGDLAGAQVGILNVGGDVAGTQVGVLNIATGAVRGAQVGVVNYADDADVTVGVLSFARKGTFHLDVYADELQPANVGVRLGGRHVYGILTAGLSGSRTFDGELRWTTGLGAGGHIPVGLPALSFVNVELLARSLHYGNWDGADYLGVNTLRAYAGWQLAPGLALVAGPTLNVSVAGGDAMERVGGLGLFGSSTELYRGNDTAVHLWPGFMAGLQLF